MFVYPRPTYLTGNFSSMMPEEIIDLLKQEMLLKSICQKVIYRKVIEKAAAERGIAVTPEEVQTEAENIRHKKRLEKASDTLVWLEEQMVTVDEWEQGIASRLLAKKLAAHLFDKEVAKYFAQTRFDFDRVILYQIVVPYKQLAQEIFYQIEEEEISFYEAAHLYDIDEERRFRCGYEGKLPRWSLKPEVAASVFGASVRKVFGPLQTDLGYHLFLVKDFIHAELTPEKRQEIINKLFKEWLESESNYLLYNQQQN
ncbi:peptidylprolyl isomerase [Pleurocapsa sp. PCC 7319]|uniref:peptidylprolyl isomerase n=1 Tax=Pleurocapsa sp. PCC 7319 TaxID=118161 RepID=UPI001181C37D|nr:peptidylprolyl isomerase [Pleurocapsa sp. PCC 7319]